MRHAVIRLEKSAVRIEIDIEFREKSSVAPHRTIDMEPVERYTELGISMLGWEKRGRRWDETVGGQGADYVLEHFGDAVNIRELVALWRLWHLNGLRPGTRKQRDALTENALLAHNAPDRFQRECDLLSRLGLNPDGEYRYGSAWLVERLPAVVEARIEWLVDALGGKFGET